MIYIGADHRGLELKENLKKFLSESGCDYEDMGPFEKVPDDDFVDYAASVARSVAADPQNRGIVMCRNGVGVNIAADKIAGIRAVLGFDAEQVRLARNDDDVNVLALPNDFVSQEKARELIRVFLETPFEGHERFMRRINKIKELEK